MSESRFDKLLVLAVIFAALLWANRLLRKDESSAVGPATPQRRQALVADRSKAVSGPAEPQAELRDAVSSPAATMGKPSALDLAMPSPKETAALSGFRGGRAPSSFEAASQENARSSEDAARAPRAPARAAAEEASAPQKKKRAAPVVLGAGPGATFDEEVAAGDITGSAVRQAAEAAVPQRTQFEPKLLRRQEEKIQNVWLKYWNDSPIVRQYESDWFKYPDLAELTMNYKASHDPIAFMRGLLQSKNFRLLAAEYIRAPVMRALLTDAVKTADPEAKDQAGEILDRDHKMGAFVVGVGKLAEDHKNDDAPPGKAPAVEP